MKNRDHYRMKHNGQHPQTGIGLFFILLGVALLIATNDLLHLGSVSEYFTWQSVLIFVGVILLFNLHFTGGILMIAGGVWFLLDDIYVVIPRIIEVSYWPSVIILIGIIFILSSLFKRRNNNNL